MKTTLRQITPFLFLLALFISCTGCETDLSTGETLTEEPTDNGQPTTGEDDAMPALILSLVNQNRRNGCRCGNQNMPPVAPVTLNAQLTAAARAHSQDQARMQRMQHKGSDGSNVGTRVTRAGYTWRNVGENVAWNYPDAGAVMTGWLNSPGHCKNLMSANFTEMGMAETDLYWTQVFAR